MAKKKVIIFVVVIISAVVGIIIYNNYRRSQSLLYTDIALSSEYDDIIEVGGGNAPLTDPDTKLCLPSEMPPCKAGFRQLKVTDKKKNLASMCCVPDTKVKDPSAQAQLAETAIFMAEMMALDAGFTSLTKLVAREIYYRASMLTPRGVSNLRKLAANSFSLKAFKASTSLAGKSATAAAVKAAQIKIAKALAQRKLAIEAVKLSAKMGRMAATAAIGPVGWVLNAIQAVGMVLDFGDAGGYDKKKSAEQLREFAINANTAFADALRESNRPSPELVGPFQDLPDPPPEGSDANRNECLGFLPTVNSEPTLTTSDLKKYSGNCAQGLAIEEFIAGYKNAVYNTPGVVLPTNPTDLADFDGQLDAQAEIKAQTPEGQEWIIQRICESLDGQYHPGEIPGKGQCSYATENECNNSYDWSKIRDSMVNATEHTDNKPYVEWIGNKCQKVIPAMRSNCDDHGLQYDLKTQTCFITPEYCQSQVLQWIPGQDGTGDCHLSAIQNAMEMIFGKTLTRAIITAFERPEVAASWLIRALENPAHSIASVLDFVAVAATGLQNMIISIGDLIYKALNGIPIIGSIVDVVYKVVNGFGKEIIVEIGNQYNTMNRNAQTTINLIQNGFDRAGVQCRNGQVGLCLQTSFETAGQAIVSGVEGIADNTKTAFEGLGNVFRSWR